MHPEQVWEWLDAVDQDHLCPLEQWGVPPAQYLVQSTQPLSTSVSHNNDKEAHQEYMRKCNPEVARRRKPLPPTGILQRNGSVRATGKNVKFLVPDEKNANHIQSQIPSSPTTFAHERASQSLVPGLPTSNEATGHRSDASTTRQLQSSGREGNSSSANPKRMPTRPERSRQQDFSEDLPSVPIIHVEVHDQVAINCQGARVVGCHRQSSLLNLPGMKDKSYRNTTAGEGGLHRRNVVRRSSNVRAQTTTAQRH